MFEISDEQRLMGELAGRIIKRDIEKTSHDLIYKDMDLTDPQVIIAINACFQDFTFTFMKALNLRLNGADAEKMGNINEFIQLLEAKYQQSEDLRKEIMEE